MWVLASVILESWQFQWERAKESMFFFRFCIESWLTIILVLWRISFIFLQIRSKVTATKTRNSFIIISVMKRCPFFIRISSNQFLVGLFIKKINKKAPFRDAPIMSNKRTLKENMIHIFRFSSTKAT